MTQTACIPLLVPDLREVPFGELASPETVEQVLQRVLPEPRKLQVSLAGFSSSL